MEGAAGSCKCPSATTCWATEEYYCNWVENSHLAGSSFLLLAVIAGKSPGVKSRSNLKVLLWRSHLYQCSGRWILTDEINPSQCFVSRIYTLWKSRMGVLPQQAHPSSPLDVAVELGTIEIM
jgi:hypothetical protein